MSRNIARLIDPVALDFYAKLTGGGYQPESLLKVLPHHKLIYVAVPKAASTRIRMTLARIEGRFTRSLNRYRRAKYRGPYGPRNIAVGSFFRLAMSEETLRFSFVRNPYARVVSCWADKFAGKPLVAGDFFIDIYLAARQAIDGNLPAGPDHTLSFANFVIFAATVAEAGHDMHLQTQDAILSIPGIALDLIGKVENFDADFARVLDYLNAAVEIRRDAIVAVNESHHDDWSTFYTGDLADRIYRAYERDFDRFGYARHPASRAGNGVKRGLGAAV